MPGGRGNRSLPRAKLDNSTPLFRWRARGIAGNLSGMLTAPTHETMVAAFMALSLYGPLAVWLGAFGPRRRALAAVLAASPVALVHLVQSTAPSAVWWHPAWVATAAVGATAVCLAVRVQVCGLRPPRAGAGR